MIEPAEITNRFAFHPATTTEKRNQRASVRTRCGELAHYINQHVPDGREKALAVTKI